MKPLPRRRAFPFIVYLADGVAEQKRDFERDSLFPTRHKRLKAKKRPGTRAIAPNPEEIIFARKAALLKRGLKLSRKTIGINRARLVRRGILSDNYD